MSNHVFVCLWITDHVSKSCVDLDGRFYSGGWFSWPIQSVLVCELQIICRKSVIFFQELIYTYKSLMNPIPSVLVHELQITHQKTMLICMRNFMMLDYFKDWGSYSLIAENDCGCYGVGQDQYDMTWSKVCWYYQVFNTYNTNN